MSDNIGKLILRVMMGGMLLFHGIAKALHGTAAIEGMLKVYHIPEILVYGVYLGEILAPIFLILGWKSRFWAGVIVLNMATAVYLTKMGTLMKLGAYGGWAPELPMLYLLGALAVVFLGSGKYAIEPSR